MATDCLKLKGGEKVAIVEMSNKFCSGFIEKHRASRIVVQERQEKIQSASLSLLLRDLLVALSANNKSCYK